MKIKLFFAKHHYAIITAIIIGVLYLMPQLFFQLSLGNKFQGIYRAISNDEPYYMARAQEVVDGHYFLSNPYFLEHKSGLPMQLFLPDLLLALPAKVFNLGIYSLYEFYDLLLPAIAFFLTYLIFYFLIKDKFWSAYLGAWIFLIKYYDSFNRPISPQFVFIFALTLVYLLLKIIGGKSKNRWLVILACVNFGFLFYMYPYLWTYFSVVLVLLMLCYIWLRDSNSLKRIIFIFTGGYIIGLPYFYQTWQASQLPSFTETLSRLGMIYTRFPSGVVMSGIGLIILILLVYDSFHHRNEHLAVQNIFFIVAIVAFIINFNQHLITGKNFFFSSHYEIISYFITAFAIAYLIWQWKKIVFFVSLRSIRMVAFVLLLTIFIPIFNQNISFDYKLAIRMQSWKSAMNWLNQNTEIDDVVIANGDLSNYIPSYTHNNIVFNSVSKLHFVSTPELLDRFVFNDYWQQDFSPEFVKTKLSSIYGLQNKALAGQTKQQNKIKKLLNLPQDDLTDIYFPLQQIQYIINYADSIKEGDWVADFKKYHVRYIVVENNEDFKLINAISKFKFIELVYQNNVMAIYGVNDSKFEL